MSLFNRKTNVKHIAIPVDDKSSQQESENAKNNEEPILAIKAILIATKRAKSFIEKMMEIKARNQKAKKTNQQEKELYQKEMAIFKTTHETLINIRDLIEEYHLFKGCKIFLMPWKEKQKQDSNSKNMHLYYDDIKGLIYHYDKEEFNFANKNVDKQITLIKKLFTNKQTNPSQPLDIPKLDDETKDASCALLDISSERKHTQKETSLIETLKILRIMATTCIMECNKLSIITKIDNTPSVTPAVYFEYDEVKDEDLEDHPLDREKPKKQTEQKHQPVIKTEYTSAHVLLESLNDLKLNETGWLNKLRGRLSSAGLIYTNDPVYNIEPSQSHLESSLASRSRSRSK